MRTCRRGFCKRPRSGETSRRREKESKGMKGRSLFRASWHLQGVSAVNQDVRLRSLVKDLNIGNYSETEDWGLVGYWRARESFNSVRYIRLWEFARTKLSVFGEQLWTQLLHHRAVVGYRDRWGGHRRPGFSYLLWYHDRLLHRYSGVWLKVSWADQRWR